MANQICDVEKTVNCIWKTEKTKTEVQMQG